MKTLSFELRKEQRCEIIFGKNIDVVSPESIFVMDSGLNNLMPKKSGDVHVLPGGEHVKSIDRVFELYQLFRTKGQSRVVALGGGAIIDLAGYSAFSHSQIEEFYAVPSTSLSQTLLPLHGKFYINFEFKKDMLAIYGLPDKIYIDPGLSYSRFLERGNCELMPFLFIAYSYDEHAFRYLERLFGSSEKLSIDAWSDIIWIVIKLYSERVNDSPGVIGMRFANILESAFRLKLDFLNALAFGVVFEIWLGKIFGVVKGEENLLGLLRKFWSRQWPLRLDFSSINEYLSQIKKLELEIPCFGNAFHEKINAEDFFSLLKDHGKELESLL
ncbi:hypothetical protein AT15_03635 [Kosmotoga arenicorallina S304]|uniref:3-dehydroquinate synthase N-terminal domain-containing protein n=1 Tax=Kosmotoga arenicorallina S304 TaxID=1453497 RepID=A0A182C8N4_9BACT|nr:hypothetical protein [Kosmotoga arenicorallina]OAA31929.1 hypothetical protein AT15_03635 [Kosmotoga arenicorallina S304]